MAEGCSRQHFTGEEVLALLDMDGEDEAMDDSFFPGSDDELGFLEEDDDDSDSEAGYE